MYQGAGSLNLEDFHQGNMDIQDFAWTKLHENDAVSYYQQLQVTITTDILTLEVLTHTPIITNATTEITLDSDVQKSEKELAKERKAMDKKIKKEAEEEEKLMKKLEKEEEEAEAEAGKAKKEKKEKASVKKEKSVEKKEKTVVKKEKKTEDAGM